MNPPFVKWWVPVYCYMGAIFFVSSLPKPLPPSLQIPYLDKGLHMVEYGFLGYLLARALASDSPPALKRRFRIWAIFFAAVYGLSDEWHQSFVPMREASVADFFFDGIGASLGQLLFHLKSI